MQCIDARNGQEQKYIEQFRQFAYVPAFFFFFFFFGVATSAADFNNNAVNKIVIDYKMWNLKPRGGQYSKFKHTLLFYFLHRCSMYTTMVYENVCVHVYIYSVYTRYHACYINKYIRVCTLGTHVVWYIKIQ